MNKISKKSFILIITCLLLFQNFAYSNEEKTYKDIIKKNKNSNYIFLFVERSAEYLDWSSPSNLARTTLYSQLMKKINNDASSIGHAQLAWHCSLGNDKYIDGATGQTGQNGSEGTQLVLKGIGLGILDVVFLDGYLETPEEVEERIKIADRRNNLAWISFKVDKKSCLSLSSFIQEYSKSGAPKNYGFPVDPLKYEGGGCTSFANACLTKINKKIPILKSWIRKVKVPLKYVGNLYEILPNTTISYKASSPNDEYKISFLDFIFGNVQWARDNEEYKDFYYYDPELFYESLVNMENYYRDIIGLKLKKAYRTDKEDETQIKNRLVSQEWIKKLLNKGNKIKLEKIYSTSGLVVDLR
jgi:hypothetical protein